jgi:hypothetical protein
MTELPPSAGFSHAPVAPIPQVPGQDVPARAKGGRRIMKRHAARRRRRRSDGRGGYLFGAAVYAALLFGVNSWPGWEAVPFLSGSAASLVWMVNLSLGVGLLAQLACAVDDTARVRALGVYGVALANIALLLSLLQVFPFDFGDVDPAWATATRLVLSALLMWACIRAMRSAVRLALGPRQVRLAAGHA